MTKDMNISSKNFLICIYRIETKERKKINKNFQREKLDWAKLN